MMRAGIVALAAAIMVAGCSGRAPGPTAATDTRPTVVAIEGFCADFTRAVAGDRVNVVSMIPPGMEPHSYEPTPRDIATVAGARLLIVNGAGLESFLSKLLQTAGGNIPTVEASAGLKSRTAREGEAAEGGTIVTGPSTEPDPHFWLDPTKAEIYIANIRDALIRLDPAGSAVYQTNAAGYVKQLQELDAWIAKRVSVIPVAERLLVTNHESFGYFADRYGFRIVGTVIPSVSTEASPTAQQVARLVDTLKAAHARAVFLETGANPQLARQVASEAGIKVVTELFTHSLSDAAGPAPSYLVMMRYDVDTIVAALTGGGP